MLKWNNFNCISFVKMKILIASVIIIVNLFRVCQSANILVFSPYCSKSHHSIHQTIATGLAAREHHVTAFSHFKSGPILPNYKEIIIGKTAHQYIDSLSLDHRHKVDSLKKLVTVFMNSEQSTCNHIFSMVELKEILNSKKRIYDLVIAEGQWIPCFNFIAHRLNSPLILVFPTAMSASLDFTSTIGNPDNPAVVPLLASSYSTQMTFFERLENAISYCYLNANHYNRLDGLEKISKSYFSTDLPSVQSLQQQVSLVFYNNHLSFINRVSVPNAVNIGGIHIREFQPLPADLLDYIDGAKDGVIFFSFGTTIKASSIHPEKLTAIKAVFSSIPQRVIWRTNELNMTDLPDNVKIGHWFPQRDILEHKNVKAFISHCGLFGTLEAIYTATPVIGIPFIFDQFQDARILVEKGAAVLLEYDSLNKDTLLAAINEIIYNKKYQENMQKLSIIFKDRPISPLDTAIYWAEYVIRHKGAPHLRVAGADMPLYQYLLLDVIAFIILVIVTTLYLLKFLISKIVSCLFKNTKKYKKS